MELPDELPLVSIIMATYNRAKTLERAINSVLNQTYSNLELIIVDDGSNDNTENILNSYKDPRIVRYKHQTNMGVTAAKNTGLRMIRGEWFTTFDSDDEMLPDAIATMMDVPLRLDNKITAVTCNCYIGYTKEFAGKGLESSGYIIANEVMPATKGDFWGLNKTNLLEESTFNDKLYGLESTLWYRLNERANCYYLHKALNIIHMDSSDRISVKTICLKKIISHYESLIEEDLYLHITKKYKHKEYLGFCKEGIIAMRLAGNDKVAQKYIDLFKETTMSPFMRFIFGLKFPPVFYKTYFRFHHFIRTGELKIIRLNRCL